ncbi:hypothetical protein nvc2_007 [Namao virus]|nr:hypothetical protein nvc2_007 [Namao virus]
MSEGEINCADGNKIYYNIISRDKDKSKYDLITYFNKHQNIIFKNSEKARNARVFILNRCLYILEREYIQHKKVLTGIDILNRIIYLMDISELHAIFSQVDHHPIRYNIIIYHLTNNNLNKFILSLKPIDLQEFFIILPRHIIRRLLKNINTLSFIYLTDCINRDVLIYLFKKAKLANLHKMLEKFKSHDLNNTIQDCITHYNISTVPEVFENIKSLIYFINAYDLYQHSISFLCSKSLSYINNIADFKFMRSMIFRVDNLSACSLLVKTKRICIYHFYNPPDFDFVESQINSVDIDDVADRLINIQHEVFTTPQKKVYDTVMTKVFGNQYIKIEDIFVAIDRYIKEYDYLHYDSSLFCKFSWMENIKTISNNIYILAKLYYIAGHIVRLNTKFVSAHIVNILYKINNIQDTISNKYSNACFIELTSLTHTFLACQTLLTQKLNSIKLMSRIINHFNVCYIKTYIYNSDHITIDTVLKILQRVVECIKYTVDITRYFYEASNILHVMYYLKQEFFVLYDILNYLMK